MTKRKARPVVKGQVTQAKASFAAALDAAYPAKATSPSRPAASDEHRLMSAMAKAIIYKSLTPAPLAFKILPTPFAVVHDSILKVQYKTKFAKDNLNDILLRSPFSLGFYTLTKNGIKLIQTNLEFVFPTAPARLKEMLPYVPWPPFASSEPPKGKSVRKWNSAKHRHRKPASEGTSYDTLSNSSDSISLPATPHPVSKQCISDKHDDLSKPTQHLDYPAASNSHSARGIVPDKLKITSQLKQHSASMLEPVKDGTQDDSVKSSLSQLFASTKPQSAQLPAFNDSHQVSMTRKNAASLLPPLKLAVSQKNDAKPTNFSIEHSANQPPQPIPVPPVAKPLQSEQTQHLATEINMGQNKSKSLIDSIKTTTGTPVASPNTTFTDLPDAPDTNTVPCKTLPTMDSAWLDPDTVLSSDPIQSMLQLLPPDLAIVIHDHLRSDPRQDSILSDIIADQGRPVRLRYCHNKHYTKEVQLRIIMNIEEAIARINAVHAVQHKGDAQEAFATSSTVGINGTLHRISAMKDHFGKVYGLTYRIGRHLPDVAESLADVVSRAANGSQRGALESLLLLGPPGIGKTTLLRAVTCQLADKFNKLVMVVDSSAEIAGGGHVPHACIGTARRMLGGNQQSKAELLQEAVTHHGPEVLVVDDIGSLTEVTALRGIAHQGLLIVASAHGSTLQRLLANPALNSLVGGKHNITAGGSAAGSFASKNARQERAEAPSFPMLIEVIDYNQYCLHTDVAASVDALLAGRQPAVEHRSTINCIY